MDLLYMYNPLKFKNLMCIIWRVEVYSYYKNVKDADLNKYYTFKI
jgi:hypothetical protein